MTSSVFPTGTTIYSPEQCWNGYTVFQTGMHGGLNSGAVLIDMNGNVVNLWKYLDGFPNKILPGGYILGSTGVRDSKYGYQDMLDLVQVNWEGKITWKFNSYEMVKDPEQKPSWMTRQHHDYQREGNPVGYFVPGMDPLIDKGYTLILCHKNLKNSTISEKLLLDDTIIKITWKGEITWEWVCSEHFEELGFSEEAKNAMYRNPGMKPAGGGMGDWMHINSMSLLGPNRWFDQGDQRFHPDNIIWDSRQANIIAIIDRESGRIVWKMGPEYIENPQLKNLGQIIGQHHAHLIPRGLPGEGNILVFDNGGWAGYGAPNPGAPTGVDNARRDYSRVLEFDPTTFKIIWQFTPSEMGLAIPADGHRFYSGLVSAAQRLPNGNTLITEGIGGRILEVTQEHELVWEYISPYKGGPRHSTMIYRAYRVPYEWIPQVSRPQEKAIQRLDNSKFRVPGSPRKKAGRVTILKGRKASRISEEQSCVLPTNTQDKNANT